MPTVQAKLLLGKMASIIKMRLMDAVDFQSQKWFASQKRQMFHRQCVCMCTFSVRTLFSFLTFPQCAMWRQSSNKLLLHLKQSTDAHAHVRMCVLYAQTCEYLVKDKSQLSAEAVCGHITHFSLVFPCFFQLDVSHVTFRAKTLSWQI